MLQPLSDCTKGERLCPSQRLVARRPVSHRPCELQDFGDPASVLFSFHFNPEDHGVVIIAPLGTEFQKRCKGPARQPLRSA